MPSTDPASNQGPWKAWIEPLDFYRAPEDRQNFRERISFMWPPGAPGPMKDAAGNEINAQPRLFEPGQTYDITDPALKARLEQERQKPGQPHSARMFHLATEAEWMELLEVKTMSQILDPRDEQEGPDAGTRELSTKVMRELAESKAENAAIKDTLAQVLAELARLRGEPVETTKAIVDAPVAGPAAAVQPVQQAAPQQHPQQNHNRPTGRRG